MYTRRSLWRTIAVVIPVITLGLINTQTFAAPAAQQTSAPATLSGSTPLAVKRGSAKIVAPYSQSQTLRLVLGLQPPNPAGEAQFLHDLQANKHLSAFHHYLTASQWNARFAPSAQNEQSVVDWATSQGLTVTHRYANRLLVDVAAPVSTIEKAFGVSINTYQLNAKTFFSNDREPTIPANLSGVVHAVLGMNSLEVAVPAIKGGSTSPTGPLYSPGPTEAAAASAHANGSKTALAAAIKARKARPNLTNGYYDPTDLYSSQAYDWDALDNLGHCCNPFNNPSTQSPVQASIAIATAGAFAGSDLQGFQNQYSYLAYNYQAFYIDGTPGCCNNETTLDTEWTTAMANSFGCYCTTAKVYVYEGANAYLSTFTDVYNQMLSDGNARSFSTSWGCTEFSCTSQGTMDTDHNIFNAMTGQGWTLTAATGDQGAYDNCTPNTPTVQYPSTDPNVVAAGGTTLYAYPTFGGESAWTGPYNSCGGNAGGGGGGYSAYYQNRTTPDISLNAGSGENYYFGGLSGVGGTSIAAPEIAGFFAQENAYLIAVGNVCGTGSPCGPIGNARYAINNAGGGYDKHGPFYDVTSGCNGNGAGPGYCAGTGYDEATGWGSFNALQFAWAINWNTFPDNGAPAVTYSGPTTGLWYNTDQTVSWTVADTGGGNIPSGVSGFTQGWDSIPADPYQDATPGAGDSYYSGPEFANATSGYEMLSWVGQGCHTAHVTSWDNMGYGSGDVTYGPICYDTVPPVTTASLAGTSAGCTNDFFGPVTITLSASDPSPSSGVAATYYSLDGAAVTQYSAPIKVTTKKTHTLSYYSKDVAGNVESTNTLSFTNLTSLKDTPTSGVYNAPVTLTGTDFKQNETVKISWDATAEPNTTANASCGFTDSIAVPQAVLGSHTITAKGATSGQTATAKFAVRSAAVLLHASGTVGSTQSITGYGFKNTDHVQLHWGTASGPTLNVAPVTASTVGTTRAISFVVPAATIGAHKVYLVGGGSNAYATFSLTG